MKALALLLLCSMAFADDAVQRGGNAYACTDSSGSFVALKSHVYSIISHVAKDDDGTVSGNQVAILMIDMNGVFHIMEDKSACHETIVQGT